ncbi:unnamed protein product [Schistocephalus solidus]|uniref:N-acetyltransferase domain-containing protein n=1 Tax=Schistocephalus solidus TaxID=70667 RepID=A0A183TIE5_SCHSO|nr:unnamed protein product [Schistocephalus solidus]
MPGFIVPKLTEKDYERDHHERFIETQFGYLDYHDYPGQKYYRNFQGEHDLDLIRRYIPYNLCSGYPDVTYRYFAMNWPELCIFAFTDTHIPIGVIMGHQIEPRRARITMWAVEHRVDHKVVCKFSVILFASDKESTDFRF